MLHCKKTPSKAVNCPLDLLMKSFLAPLGIGKVTETSLKRSLRGALVALDVEVQVSLLSWKGP